MPKILTTETYHDEVRERLGVDDGVLSDTSIDAPSVLPIAEARVLDRVSQFCEYTTLQDDDKAFLYAAAVCMLASVLAPSMAARIKQSEGDSDYKYTNGSVDWDKRKQDLEDEAYTMIDYISVQTVTELKTMTASGPTRSQPQKQPSITSGDEYFGNLPRWRY